MTSVQSVTPVTIWNDKLEIHHIVGRYRDYTMTGIHGLRAIAIWLYSGGSCSLSLGQISVCQNLENFDFLASLRNRAAIRGLSAIALWAENQGRIIEEEG